MKTELGWLIELQLPGRMAVDWWAGSSWTPEAFDAIRFCRKADAEKALKYLFDQGPVCSPDSKVGVVEHMFYSA